MPATKQVRFAYKNQVYPASSTLPVPPLSHSVSTAPSSTALLTPNYALSYPLPYAPSNSSRIPPHVYMPPRAPSSGSRYAGQARAHPYLSMDGISWDLRDHASLISRNGHGLSSRVLSESAFEPPLPYVSIAPPHLPWSFKIHASNGRYVTLGDVFGTLYHNLRVNITEPEFNSLADKRKPTQAYEERYRRLRSRRAYEEEKRGGMKRVDLLKRHTRFLALVNSGRLPDEWLLKVSWRVSINITISWISITTSPRQLRCSCLSHPPPIQISPPLDAAVTHAPRVAIYSGICPPFLVFASSSPSNANVII